MALAGKLSALGLSLMMVSVVFVVLTPTVSADDTPMDPAQPMGPWIDEIVWSEEGDRSKALTEIIAGNRHTIMFDITAPADKERALASDQIDTFPAFGLFDELSFNPVEMNQTAGHPRNPFTLRAVREAMQFLIDRDFVVRDIYGGFAMPYRTTFHPRSPDYGRGIADFLKLEDTYAFNPEKGRDQMFTALETAQWTIRSSADPGCQNVWHDPQNRCVTLKILKRVQDERLNLGAYYGSILRGLSFKVEEIGVTGAGIPYGTVPDENRWHIYTAGWISTSITAWDDGQLNFFAACDIGEPYCYARDAPPGYYQPPQRLLDIAETLQFGQYNDLNERALLTAEGTALAMSESLRIFIDARQSLFINNKAMTGMTWDLFGGNANPWAVKTANVPVDAGTGIRTAKILNLVMFRDGWNPWVYPGWLYDSVQRRAMTDFSVAPHPHTGRYIDIRTTTVDIQTAGPTGTPLSIPSDATLFNATTNTWQPVASGAQATSKVTYGYVFGNWHHGVNITMDDVMYTWSNMVRRCIGDVSQVSGVNNACQGSVRFFVQNVLKGLRVQGNNLEVYMDYWHVDPREIVAFGALFPSAPWEVQEVALKLVFDLVAVTHDADIAATGRIWLDLTKGDSLLPANLPAALTAYRTANEIPPGMATGVGGVSITPAEATARWNALDAWWTARGNFWPSNGPFYLDLVDVANRQTIMKAFRTGYPWNAEQWAALRTVAIPSVNFAATPPVVFAGTPAIFDYSVSVGPAPSDDVIQTWFLRDSSTGEFLQQGVPDRLGTGSYRIELPGTLTEELLLGNFEIISVVTGNAAAVPSIQRVSFLILPSTAWFEALLDARARIIEDEVSDLSGSVGTVQSNLDSLSGSVSGLVGLTTAMAILAVIAVVISVVAVVLTMRRGRAPPTPAPESPLPEKEMEEM